MYELFSEATAFFQQLFLREKKISYPAQTPAYPSLARGKNKIGQSFAVAASDGAVWNNPGKTWRKKRRRRLRLYSGKEAAGWDDVVVEKRMLHFSATGFVHAGSLQMIVFEI